MMLHAPFRLIYWWQQTWKKWDLRILIPRNIFQNHQIEEHFEQSSVDSSFTSTNLLLDWKSSSKCSTLPFLAHSYLICLMYWIYFENNIEEYFHSQIQDPRNIKHFFQVWMIVIRSLIWKQERIGTISFSRLQEI